MSETSSASPASLSELDDLLGGAVQSVQHSEHERLQLEASVLADRVRTLLKQAMTEDDVSVRALARRLDVSPSVISRRLSSEGDLKLWTAAALAHALGRVFEVELRKVAGAPRLSNQDARIGRPSFTNESVVFGFRSSKSPAVNSTPTSTPSGKVVPSWTVS